MPSDRQAEESLLKDEQTYGGGLRSHSSINRFWDGNFQPESFRGSILDNYDLAINVRLVIE